MNYNCNVEFNVPTNLRDDVGFSQRMKESTDAYRYVTDFRPATLCMVNGVPLQGQQVGTRGPPPQVMDIEWALRKEALQQQTNEYISADPSAAPEIPQSLRAKLLIPQCADVFTSQKTRVKKSDRPRNAPENKAPDARSKLKTDYMRPGIDTRQQIKDLYREWEEKNAKNSNIYGLSKYDSRPLTAGTNPICTAGDSNLNCMHVYGPDAKNDGKIIDPTVPYALAADKLKMQSATQNTTQNVNSSTGSTSVQEQVDELGNASWMDVYKATQPSRF